MEKEKTKWSGWKLFKKKTVENHSIQEKQEEELARLEYQKAKEAREKEYLERKKKRDEELLRAEQEKREKRGHALEQATEKWDSVIHSAEGTRYLDEIRENWNRYVTAFTNRKKLNSIEVCQLRILSYLLDEDARIKEQSEIITSKALEGMEKEDVLTAIDQLLINKQAVIAVEGSVDYFRMNFTWSIRKEIHKIAHERDLWERWEKTGDTKNGSPEEPLQSVTIEKLDKQKLHKEIANFESKIEGEIIKCIKEAKRPLTMYDICTYGGELSKISQLKVEETLRRLVKKGSLERMEGNYSVKYMLNE